MDYSKSKILDPAEEVVGIVDWLKNKLIRVEAGLDRVEKRDESMKV